ncbi:C-type lectin domain family 2 member D-like [Chelonoidis abingdonii]|uniref:C-type lectin domain family 2 member D-like n=1 Tax=Chelonoidis abingdonii TaxID=106734 RepID=UPI0013F20684|nr:C-type lectin domain family 2 member D-like [Chelonoidis abingdonii]
MGKTADSTEHSPQGLCNGDPEAGREMETQKNPQQEQLLMELSSRNGDATRERDAGCICPFRKPLVWGTVAGLVVIIIVLGTSLAVVTSKLLAAELRLRGETACPNGWVAFQEKCYYFSEAEGNRTYSQNNCSSLGASLAPIDTQQDMDFMLHYRSPRDHWFGLQREQDLRPWRWVNGTEFNNWFTIGGGGECAYLKEAKAISSSRCSMERHWICSKPHVCAKV